VDVAEVMVRRSASEPEARPEKFSMYPSQVPTIGSCGPLRHASGSSLGGRWGAPASREPTSTGWFEPQALDIAASCRVANAKNIFIIEFLAV
jgi:hypothetical protein